MKNLLIIFFNYAFLVKITLKNYMGLLLAIMVAVSKYFCILNNINYHSKQL